MRVAILTVSDAGARGERADTSGDAAEQWALARGYSIAGRALVPDETSDIVNGLMRAALLWTDSTQRPTAAVVPYGRRHTISARLQKMNRARQAIQWLQWDGE